MDAPPTAPGTPPDERRPAAFFDLDKTIIATSSATAFSRSFLANGLLTRRSVLRTGYAQLLYLLGGADAEQTERLRAELSRSVIGWDTALVSRIVRETLHEAIDPTVYAEAVALIEEHHAAGRDVVIVSASGSEIVEPIGELLGADRVVATRMQVVDGRYTGEIDFYAYGEQKAAAIRRLADEQGYDLRASFAYSDSVTDAPMLATVGHGFVVNPDRTLRRLAAAEGWGVLTFVRPVPLFSARDRRRAAGVAVAVLVTLVVLLVLRRRRRS
ncbi:HAD family hydrolase [Cellulomonas massiliensis]|uniref:HAD family hydrolase n=1 Tax=Cellulomonas massiliensis TaxID=1465811 RepID=UPI0002D53E28|nr:HAD family hydrolase [Cellulomonas massiliensis]